MEFKLDPQHGWAMTIVLLATSLIFGANPLQIVAMLATIALHMAIWLCGKATFGKDSLCVNYGFHQVEIPYNAMQKAISGRNVKIWENGKKHPWRFRISRKDKDSFLAELYRRKLLLRTAITK